MARIMYDLCGEDTSLRFSPFCWRAALAMRHKGLTLETRPWHFTDKQDIAFSGQEKVPVIVDEDEEVVTDSFEIMAWLDRKYPGPALLGDDMARARARFMKHWSETALAPALMKIAILDVFSIIDPRDQDYFRQSREQRFGMTLEEFQDTEQGLEMLEKVLTPLRAQLEGSAFIDGDHPAGADYLVFGMFMLAYVVHDGALLKSDDPVAQWHERMLDLFGGLARQAPRVGSR
ncbi:beta-aryl ether-cleaving enzyme [Kushneria pakistanensis]|uniref:Beta-aryl ether-cleaving enzyme n=1 Tax=Kushneria pakistanensis TaxID=1508770 RepID=A0ABQ3F986_9GAMM|nr:glutathione S-transferase N-terminal domain-containing protein [Kushneria pakistanensis]GHC14754.1 beta-aryl ether-cleaving enzyme [Kushneria pakistanensis]